ncbi:MAG: carboxymuconolactone decarboxylase family protein [Gammaproteobacteria bacterium]
MTRVPLLPEADIVAMPETLETVRRRRGGTLMDLDRLLLHSEPVTRGWHALFGALASECDVDIRTRELALLRIGILNDGRYEYYQHRRIALRAGITEAEIEGLKDWRASELYTSRDRAVLAYTDAMTRDVQVPDEVFEALRPHFNERQLVELTANIAGYNMVTRFMEALALVP